MNKLAKERRGEWHAEKSRSPLLAELKAEADAVKTQSKKLLLLLLVFLTEMLHLLTFQHKKIKTCNSPRQALKAGFLVNLSVQKIWYSSVFPAESHTGWPQGNQPSRSVLSPFS